ncbi:hypothetical protein [Chitiniphilus shinanonensis]|uniref:hypothetical protein n=1 Tax=Chitiniphilus shinanonensis TaxID=553088 RepID=UPI0030226711
MNSLAQWWRALPNGPDPETWPHRPASLRQTLAFRPLWTGLGCALALFFSQVFWLLHRLSPNSDSAFRGYDYFTLPRCGLAIRHGTDVFTSAETYASYGPWATSWVTHPNLCVFPGVPLSYLPPFAGYWLFNLFNLALHLFILVHFARRAAGDAGTFHGGQWRDHLMFGLLGFFFPMYVLYYQGQYHSLAVLALMLVFLQPRNPALGFIVSAFGKPLLGPAGLVLLVRGMWKTIALIALALLIGYLPWFFLNYSLEQGIHLGRNTSLAPFFDIGSHYLKYNVPRWNQEQSMASFLGEWMSPDAQLYLRYLFGLIVTLIGAVVLRRKPLELAVSLVTLWFFLVYARGHDYHATLLIPVLAYLWCQRPQWYRTRFMLLIAAMYALPTSYALFRTVLGFTGEVSGEAMLASSPLLYYCFVAQKPVATLLLTGNILWQEWLKDKAAEIDPDGHGETAVQQV